MDNSAVEKNELDHFNPQSKHLTPLSLKPFRTQTPAKGNLASHYVDGEKTKYFSLKCV